MVETDTDALKAAIAHRLERQRRVRWICLQLGKALVGKYLDFGGQVVE